MHKSPSGSTLTQTTAPRWRTKSDPKLIVIGLLCVCLGALGAGYAWQQANTTTAVVIAQRTIAQGETITLGDLGIAEVNLAAGVAVIPAERLDELLNQQALVEIASGALPAPSTIGVLRLDASLGEIGLRLSAGQVPPGELHTGTHVLLVPLADPGAETELPDPLVAQVLQPLTAQADGSSWTLAVGVELQHAPDFAALAAEQRLAVVRLGGV